MEVQSPPRPSNRIEFALLPKQLAFVQSVADEALLSGAFGCGKSLALCVKTLSRACRKGAREALIRLKAKDLKATTLKTLIQGDGDMPPVLRRGMYEYNKSEGLIKLHRGGEILLVGLDADRDKELSRIGSLNLSGAGIDQAEELTLEHWLMISGRLRVQVGDMPMQQYGVCNPGAPSHFLAQRFGIAAGSTPEYGCWCVQTETADNQFLPPKYLARVNRYTGIMYQRYVKGRWVANEGAIYEMWDRNVHVKAAKGVFKRIIFGIDDGFSVPFALVMAGVKANGSIHVLEEVYEKNLPEQSKVNLAKEMAEKYGRPEFVVCDPAAASIKGAMRAAGFTVVNGQNDVLEGITEVQNRLGIGGHGHPNLTVEATCTKLIGELEAYHWDPKSNKDKPVKENDHAVDALRYICMALRKPVALLFQAADVAKTKVRAANVAPEFIGAIDHRQEPGAAQDLALARGDSRQVFLRPDDEAPTLKIWDALWETSGKPRSDRKYIIFAGVGNCPAAIVVDTVTRNIVAQWQDDTATLDQTARVLSMLGVFFGYSNEVSKFSRAMLGYYSKGPGGGLTTELRRLRYDNIWYARDETEPGWDPIPADFSAAVQDLRVMLAREKIISYQAELVTQAQSYIWLPNGSVGPLALADAPENKGTHLDWVILAAGACLMLKTTAANPINEPVYAPGSMQARLQAKKRAEQR